MLFSISFNSPLKTTFIIEVHCHDAYDGDYAHADDPNDALALSSFQDPMELLEELYYKSRCNSFEIVSFLPLEKYLTFLERELELPCEFGPFDYSLNILYFKPRMTAIHQPISCFFNMVWHAI